jgi:hypothetical protein
MTWPSGDRDVTEFPNIDIHFSQDIREHLQDFLKFQNIGWNDFDEMSRQATGAKTPQRWRSYRKMYERLGLIYKSDNNLKHSKLAGSLAQLLPDLENKLDNALKEIALRACGILIRYRFKNPVENSPDFSALPDDCDMRPYLAIWTCMLALDGKLHYEELNRVLMHKIYLSQLDDTIDRINHARLNINYASCSSSDLETFLGEAANPDPQTAARMAAWFSLAGWGGLLIDRNNDSNGFRNLTKIGKDAINITLKMPLPNFSGTTENDWVEYYINSEYSENAPDITKFKLSSLCHFGKFTSLHGYEFN